MLSSARYTRKSRLRCTPAGISHDVDRCRVSAPRTSHIPKVMHTAHTHAKMLYVNYCEEATAEQAPDS